MLAERLVAVLAGTLAVTAEDDGALTVRHDGTLASLRVVNIAEELDLISLNQVLAWDMPLTERMRDRVADQARASQFGTVLLVEQSAEYGDVMLRYNFPGSGLSDDALRTVILLVLDSGAAIRRSITS